MINGHLLILLIQRIAKNAGVKRQIHVAVSEDISEININLQQFWSPANAVKHVIVFDMKMKISSVDHSLTPVHTL